jgi:hypothetical protein
LVTLPKDPALLAEAVPDAAAEADVEAADEAAVEVLLLEPARLQPAARRAATLTTARVLYVVRTAPCRSLEDATRPIVARIL